MVGEEVFIFVRGTRKNREKKVHARLFHKRESEA
jgi:hypothetical protein